MNKLEIEKDRLTKLIENQKAELDRLGRLTYIEPKDLYPILTQIKEAGSFELGDIKGYLKNTEYEYILGGDGRSRPWSEVRQGLVFTIDSTYYLEGEHFRIITDYLKVIGNQFDEIKFVNSKQKQ